MNRPLLYDLIGILPELCLAGCILFFIVFSTFMKDSPRSTALLGKISFLLCCFLCISFILQNPTSLYMFNGFFVRDAFSVYLKLCLTLTSVCILSFSIPTLSLEKLGKPEYFILFLVALLGMFFMVSANHFISLYLALELQSIALYVLAGLKRDSRRSSEASLKLFILGSLASVFLLFGLSFLYGITGSLNYQDVAFVLKTIYRDSSFTFQDPMVWTIFLSFTFIIVAFLFKIAAAPFHMWAPDVYEGVPLPIMIFLSLVPKIASLAILLKLISTPFLEVFQKHGTLIDIELYPFFFQGIGLISIIWGAISALFQQNIRRLLAYSGISHIGFILLAISTGNYSGFQGALLYMLIYVLMNIVLFGLLCALRYPIGHKRIGLIEDIQDLQGLSRTHPKVAFAFALIFLSMAGIPPLAGFFAKFYVLLSALEKGFIIPTIIAILASVIGAFYYLRLIKYMYFEEPDASLEVNFSVFSSITIVLSLISVSLYSLYPTPFLWSVNFLTEALLRS